MTSLPDVCKFPRTELNHDLNPPMLAKISSTTNIIELIKNSTGKCEAETIDPKILKDLYNDQQMVEYVFKLTFDNFKKIKDIINLPLINGSTCLMSSQNKPYNLELFNLFIDPVTNILFQDIFFVIDTGDNLVQTLAGFTLPGPGGNEINIHQIHSNATLADSAPKTRPDSNNYKKGNPTVKLYSWYYNQVLKTDHRDRLLISSFDVTNTKTDGTWDIRQNWQRGDYDNTVTNAKKENNKNVIKAYLETYVIPHSMRVFSAKEKIHSSYYIQRKRSGDYFQIWFAEKLPKIMKYYQPGQFNPIITPTNAPEKTKSFIFEYTESEFKNRTFFITGDWPAVCWAVLNKVNTIMVFKHPTKIDECAIYKFYFN